VARTPGRKEIDEILYSTLRAIYHFERGLYGNYGIGYEEICLLQLLRRRPGLRVGEAARILELPLFAATRLAQRLEGDGLIDKGPDPVDGRAVRLRASGAGLSLLGRIEGDSYRLVAGKAAGLSEGELAAFVLVAGNLGRILGVADKAAEDGPQVTGT
jgi:DNA-binding MarR family transcriptional regulator